MKPKLLQNIYPLLVNESVKNNYSVLIKSNCSGDEIFYQAKVLKVNNTHSYLLGFHKGSLLADMVYIYSEVRVAVIVDNKTISAVLSSMVDEEDWAKSNDLVSLVLLLEEAEESKQQDDAVFQGICPLT